MPKALKITAADLGRKVRLRNGDTVTIVKFRAGAPFPVEDVLGNRWGIAGRYSPLGQHEGDIIEFIDEAMPNKALKITKNDVGRFAKLRNGDLMQIEWFDTGEATYPVKGPLCATWSRSGEFSNPAPDGEYDIVGFEDD